MKEKYLRPAVVNANKLELSPNEKHILKSFMATLVKNMMQMTPSALSATMRRVYGAMDFGLKTSSLTERKFEGAFR